MGFSQKPGCRIINHRMGNMCSAKRLVNFRFQIVRRRGGTKRKSSGVGLLFTLKFRDSFSKFSRTNKK